MPENSPPPAPIPTCTTLDEVVDALDSIIKWSIETPSRLGYFAALYMRITIAVGVAIKQGGFEDGPRMERFDVAFAERYFAAVNGHFHPRQFRGPTHSWQVTFDAAQRAEPIIVAHMLAGVNGTSVLTSESSHRRSPRARSCQRCAKISAASTPYWPPRCAAWLTTSTSFRRRWPSSTRCCKKSRSP
jgi:hypothetical protein